MRETWNVIREISRFTFHVSPQTPQNPKERLAAILRLADEYPAVELWEAGRNAALLMETAFARKLILESTAVPDVQFDL